MTVSAKAGALTIDGLLAAATARLTEAGVETPRTDARMLVENALGLSRSDLLAHRGAPVAAGTAAVLRSLLDRRAGGEPVSRILGRREFWSLDFRLSPATLDPRPDSETIVESALSVLERRDAPLRLLDLGTGTGCLLLALLSELPNAWGLGVDREPLAASMAAHNAGRLALADRAAFVAGDWAAAITGSFDLVVSNPPYVPRPDLASLPPEVGGHDPALALDGGPDGLGAYRAILADTPDLLAPGGWLVVEVGIGQAAAVAGLFGDSALANIGMRSDLSTIERCVIGRKRLG
ncbi:MAG: peptide chain release factor N(5)-glutamine methyltransferase [Inquilinaceae bacterium]